MLLSSIIFFDVISYVVEGFMMVWAIFIIFDKVKNKQISLIKNYKLLILFLSGAIITTLIQVKMLKPINTGFDLIMLLHFCICFFILYGLHTEKQSTIEKELISIMQCTVSITTLLTFFSILFIIFKNRFVISGKILMLNPFSYCIGMHFAEGVERLSGFSINPNIIAFCSVVSIIFSHMLFIKNKFFDHFKRHTQVFLFTASLILNSAALILSDSLASFILLSTYIILILFYNLVLKNKKFSFKSLVKNFFIFLILGVITLISLTIIRGNFQSISSEVMNNIYSTFSTDDIDSEEFENITIGRGENYNIKNGSGRRHLLKQALLIFSKNPLMGIGIGNTEEYGKIYFKNGVDFPNFHNGYVSVAVSYGIIGLSLFVTFLLYTFIYFIKALRKSISLKNTIYPNLVALTSAYCVYSLFEKTMLSEINYMGVFFWFMLGYTTAFASHFLKTHSKG